ncbi:MAG TPA: GGDEF domain-containing protein [bacterium]|nr:GGDEF domain-containing protein [bacterium]HQL62650.1 GGDEF domain-containing protein [bacterium]
MGTQQIVFLTKDAERFKPGIEALESAGLKVRTMPPERESFPVLFEESPDLILADGLDRLEDIRDLVQGFSLGDPTRDNIVILLSDELNREEEFIAAGVRDMLPRNVDNRRLVARINLQLTLKSRVDELKRMAAFFHAGRQIDGLTHLYQFSVFEQRVNLEMERADPRRPFSLCLFHLDQFDAVNKAQGHMWGDVLIMELAGLLKESLPHNALGARFSANRMAVVLPDTSKEKALEWAKGFREKVRNYPISGAVEHISVSAGVVTYPEEKLSCGDKLLLLLMERTIRACIEGGNRVIASP